MEKTYQLWMAFDDPNMALEVIGNKVLLERLEKDFFPNQEEWESFSERIDDEGSYFAAKWLWSNWSSFEGLSLNGDYLEITFHNPINVVTGFQIKNGVKSDVISEAKKIRFQVTYDWYWERGSSRATSIEIDGTMVTCE